MACGNPKPVHGNGASSHIRQSFVAAIPIMLGYVSIGIPCGILCESIGMNAIQTLLMSVLFYSGAGQFMIPNMYLAAAPAASIIASVSLVNTRQLLYSASLAPYCQDVSKRMAFLFAATVTDESYGVSIARFREGDWSVDRALGVNLFSQSSWTLSNVLGVLVGSLIAIPLDIAAFAMTSIFICLLFTQKATIPNVTAAVFAILGVYLMKLLGLSGIAILFGALLGVACALAASAIIDKRRARMGSDAGSICDCQRAQAGVAESTKRILPDDGLDVVRADDEGEPR